jgi:hypothetical protein
MKQLLTFQGFPMAVVVGFVIFAWASIFSVLIGSLF